MQQEICGGNMILVIYGYGGHGLEVEELARIINIQENKWDRVIFVDDTPSKIDNKKVFSFEDIISKHKPEDIEFMVGIGEPVIREKIFNKVKERGYNFATLVHPSASVAGNARIEEGTVICYNAYVSVDTYLAENSLVQPMSVVGHGCMIGKNSVISAFVSMGGNSRIGDNSFVGMNVPIKQGAVIGSGSVVGMGSVVVRDIPDGVVAVGNPARPMKNDNIRAFR